MSSLTERHRALNIAAEANTASWVVGSNGSGIRNWFALRKPDGPNSGYEYHKDKNGDLIRYTEAGALSRAEALNKLL